MKTVIIQSLLDDSQVAERLQVSIATLRRWRLLGSSTLPFIRIGRSIRYDPADVESWIALNKRAA